MLLWLLMLLIGLPVLLSLEVIWLSMRLLPLMKRVVGANRL